MPNKPKAPPPTGSTRVSELGGKKVELFQESLFYMLAQSRATNTLARNLTRRILDPTQLDLYGNGKVETKDFRLFIRGYNELLGGINTSASKLLDSLLITATGDGLRDTLVALPLKDYMQMRGLKDEKETRKQVKRDLDALARVRFEYRGKGKEKDNWLHVALYGGTSGIKNGVIFFRFNEDFYHSLQVGEGKYLFMFFPKEALRLKDNAHPYSYALARRIAEHKRINIGARSEDKIGVQTLIAACPGFPTYEEVMAGNRNISDRIIAPFERDMDALSEAFVWEYVGEQPETYQEFTDAQVRIRWRQYPPTKDLIESKEKRRKTEKKPS